MKYLLAVAVENYKDPKLAHAAGAASDAQAFVAALQVRGWGAEGSFLHVDGDASKTAIESRLRRLQKQLRPEDELVIYYAGHGFTADGESVLAAWDSETDDLENTAVPLSSLLHPLHKKWPCGKITLFLDARRGEAAVDPASPGAAHGVLENDLKKFCGGSEHCVAFTACKPDEMSYVNPATRHGVWNCHLVQALMGRAPRVLQNGVLTAKALQDYLRQEVPRTLREMFSDGRRQTPQMFGGDEIVMADVAEFTESAAAAAAPTVSQLPHVSFSGKTFIDVKKLSGFQRFHKVPKAVDDYGKGLVKKLGAADVDRELKEAFGRIRQGMKYARRDLKMDCDGGAGTIITPDFEYALEISQDDHDAASAVFSHIVVNIKTPEVIMSADFNATFDGIFDAITFASPVAIEVSDIIDHIEDHKPPGITLGAYEPDGSSCVLQIDGLPGHVTITGGGIVVSSARGSPEALVRLFTATWNALLPMAPPGALPPPVA